VINTCNYFGVYVVYINALHFLTHWEAKLLIGGDMIPFFLLLAIVNEIIAKSNKEQGLE